ncbi:MAG: aldo/keto reductase [Acidobacteriaceae bacterium]|nr:aldo/keto reductase [Acidobacteriaceae bacterium]
MKRRHFLQNIAAGSLATTPALAQQPAASDEPTLPHAESPGELKGEMLYRKLGNTGVTVSAIGLGGSHIGKASLKEDESIRLIHEAIDRGITFMDNCWDYNEGRSERVMGAALSQGGYRDKVFLMTKIDGRAKDVAARQIETSLQRLKITHIDLLQHHEILRYDDPDRIFAEGGAMEAVLEAKQAGKVRFIGFTGHKDPRVHLYMLEVAAKHGFHFDTVQLPLNLMDAHFRSFARLVVPKLVKQQIGVLGMKPFCGGDGIILKTNTVQPLDCLHYALNLPTSVVITGIDKKEALDQAFQAAKTFQPINDQQLASLLSKTRQVAMTGQFELFKTTSHFDATARHPDWLGADTPSVQKLAPELPG